MEMIMGRPDFVKQFDRSFCLKTLQLFPSFILKVLRNAFEQGEARS